MAIGVEEVTTPDEATDLRAEISARVYAGDCNYRAPSRRSVLVALSRERFRGGQKLLVAREDGLPAAFVVARMSPGLSGNERPVGVLGFFEALERPAATRYLFTRAIRWLIDSGAARILGPMNGDTWHSYRLNVGPWDDAPFPMEPYNPPYYPALWEASGFRSLEEYHSTQVVDLAKAIEALAPKHRRALESGYRFERFRKRRFRQELGRVHTMSCEIFRDNPLYTEISHEEFLELYAGAASLIDPDLVRFAVAAGGQDAGFLFALPGADAVNVKTLGVARAHRRAGLGGALTLLAYRAARDKHLRSVNLCLMHDANPSSRLDAGLGRVLRRYRLYEWVDE